MEKIFFIAMIAAAITATLAAGILMMTSTAGTAQAICFQGTHESGCPGNPGSICRVGIEFGCHDTGKVFGRGP